MITAGGRTCERLEGSTTVDDWFTRRLAQLPSIGMSSRQIVDTYAVPIPDGLPQAARRERIRQRNRPALELRDSVLLHAVYV